MSEPTRPIDDLLAHLAKALDLADALDTAAHTGSEIEIIREDTDTRERLGGQGALDRLIELRHDIGAIGAVAQAISLAKIADKLERLTEIAEAYTRPSALAMEEQEPPPPVTVQLSGCCRVPLGEPHDPKCRWAGYHVLKLDTDAIGTP